MVTFHEKCYCYYHFTAIKQDNLAWTCVAKRRQQLVLQGSLVCILRARVQPTLDPYAEAFL